MKTAIAGAVTVMFVGAGLAGVLVQAQGNMVHTHIGHVADGWQDTPDGAGLLPTALAEAQIAVQHAGFAAGNPDDLDSIKLHTGHVLHAVDPSVMANGPGKGYGVKKAATGAAQHIQAAAGTDGASENVATHAPHVATSANNAVAWADEIVELAKQVEAATSAAAAAELAGRINALAQQIVSGVDANGDGRVGWQEGEGGLEQAEQHLGFMKAGEGLS